MADVPPACCPWASGRQTGGCNAVCWVLQWKVLGVVLGTPNSAMEQRMASRADEIWS